MSKDSHGRYYQLVLIRVIDPPKFGKYLELLRPAVLRYGGSLERTLAPDSFFGESMPMPEIVNVVHYDSRSAFEAFQRDPEFQKIVHLRSESIAMAVVNGFPIGGEVTQGDLDKRRYVVEVARYGTRGADGYRQYEREAQPILARYGYHVERVLAPDSTVGFPFEPDVAKVAYFDTGDAMDRLNADSAHERLEKDLHPNAVARSVWIIGRVQASVLPGGPR